MNDTKRLKVTMYLDVDRESVDEITKITHHAERLLDLESYPEIKSVSGVTVENPDKDYTFKTIKEVADEIMTLPFGTSLDFTFDQPEDNDGNFSPSGWHGMKRVKLFDEPYGTLCFGIRGGGDIEAKEIFDSSDVAEMIRSYCMNPEIEYLCVSSEYTSDWIPVKQALPEETEDVQVTYLGYSSKPCCDGFAFIDGEGWCWSDSGEQVGVEITAWKPLGEPYKGE